MFGVLENMIKWQRKIRGFMTECEAYTLEEAADRDIEAVHWHDALPNRWAKTDDGYVVRCVRVIEYKEKRGQKRTRRYMEFTCGAIFVGKHNKLNFMERYERNELSGLPGRSWIDKEIRRHRVFMAVQAFVSMAIRGVIDWDKLGLIYRPDQKIPRATVRRLFKQEKVQIMVKEELRKTLAEEGLTVKWVAEKIKEAATLALQVKEPGTILKAADMTAELLEMKPGKTPTIKGAFLAGMIGASQPDEEDEFARQIEAEEKRIPLPPVIDAG